MLWQEGAYFIAIALVLFTGIWPFVKNLLVLWVTFGRSVDGFLEQKSFHLLSVLGKLGLMDIIVVTAAVAVFSEHPTHTVLE